jgi:hypothetical protein
MTHIILDDPSIVRLNQAFDNDPTGAAYLRHYCFVSQNIKRLEYELDRHLEERRELFEHMTAASDFRKTIKPVVRAFRRESRAKGFHPYTQQPLTPPPRSPRLPLSRQQSPTSSTLRTRTPHPSSPSSSTSIHMTKEEDAIIAMFLQLDNTLGTAQNPIIILDDDNEPQCERCRKKGHIKQNCDTPIRSFLVCEVCKWKRQSQDKCPHVDMSPVAFQKLRGNIPYDHGSD